MTKKKINLEIRDEFQEQILAWGKDNFREYPWRETNETYRILVTEILLQQTISIKVSRIYSTFFEMYPTIESLAKANVEDVKNLIFDLGFHYRAKILKEMAKKVLEFEKIPSSKDDLMKLKGVGDYISTAVCIFAFDQNLPLLDTNTKRIVSRFWGVEKNKEIEKILDDINPTNPKVFYWSLIDYGALICKAPYPKCDICPILKKCNYKGKRAKPVKKCK